MTVHGSVAGCVVVVVCLMALLAERSEGHITFFSPKEMMLMKEREGRKEMEPLLEEFPFQEGSVQRVERGGNPDKTEESAVHLSPKQLDRVTPVLEKIVREIVDERQKAK